MRLFLLTALTMTAFASNSILNRLGLIGGGMDPVSFASIRLVAGAVMLGALCLVLRGGLSFGGRGRALGVFALLLYIYAFSTAYTALDAGLGALILFGVTQVTMFAGGLMAGEATPPRRWAGAAVSLCGLAWLLWPGPGSAVSLWHGGLMAVSGVGWGLYSLAGRGSEDALTGTAANFLMAAPVGVALGLALPGGPVEIDTRGVVIAIVAGAITSGLGYALWYTVLPRLLSSVAAVAQLTVPVIAMAGGMVVLGEALSLRFVLGSVLVLGGVALSVLRPRRGQEMEQADGSR